jgi:hypothetical protein
MLQIREEEECQMMAATGNSHIKNHKKFNPENGVSVSTPD